MLRCSIHFDAQNAKMDAMSLSGILFGLNLHAAALQDSDSKEQSEIPRDACAIRKWAAGRTTLHFANHKCVPSILITYSWEYCLKFFVRLVMGCKLVLLSKLHCTACSECTPTCHTDVVVLR